ncbi:MAG: hypothetical protein LUH51_04465 [Firmicutes bacterium]|nr:hypothetical protein [Bacillota bacterium]
MEKYKRKWGDRWDGRWVREAPGLQTIMAHLLPNRTDCEVYLNQDMDVTELMRYLEQKNASHPEYKTTIFHCVLLILARMVRERPLMNRFVRGGRIYERYEISMGFTCKRKFEDHAEESLMVIVPTEEDNLDSLSRYIVGEVKEMRKSDHATGGVDSTVEAFAKIPRFLLLPIIKGVRFLDFWGKTPRALTAGDPNFCSIFATNLGSIKCPSIYHHLNNYGTNSMMVSIGTLHKEERLMPDGTRQIRDILDVGVTLDERIGDGFYFIRSLKLVQYISQHPEILDWPLGKPSGFDYQ